MTESPEISVICPVGKYVGDLAAVHREAREALLATGRRVEFIYILDGPSTNAERYLEQFGEDRFPVTVLRMARGFGEATALQVGFERAAGRLILTIPDRRQVTAETLLEVLARLDAGDAVVVTHRYPRSDAMFNRLQSRVFHALVRRLVGQNFRDMTCGVRGMTSEAARKLELYGDQHRFIPIIAIKRGYPVVEVPGRQHAANERLRVYGPGVYVRRLLDILNIYFLSRFTRKPLRFFGLIGAVIGTTGLALTGYLAVERLMGASALADRPLLLLGILLIVLGVQVTSIGLLGEITIFLAARRDTPEVSELRLDRETATARR